MTAEKIIDYSLIICCLHYYFFLVPFPATSSQFEEKFEDINAAEAPPNLPSTSGINENQATTSGSKEIGGNDIETKGQENNRICSNVGTSNDFMSGIMKIVPDVDSDADYWLLSDADVSITDMWKTESGVYWNDMSTIQEDFGTIMLLTCGLI